MFILTFRQAIEIERYTPEIEQLAPEKWWLEDGFPFVIAYF